MCVFVICRYAFASGADEKVVRVFQAPKNFVETFAKVSALDLSKDVETTVRICKNYLISIIYIAPDGFKIF